MKFLIIGLGSMGKRRIRLLKENYPNIVLIGVDSREDRREDVEKLYDLKTHSDLLEAIKIEKPNSAIVCTNPISHSNIIIECLNKNLNVFTEINLVSDKYTEIIKIADENKLKLFLSSTFLYRKETQIIKEKIGNELINYRYHVGQYLPDWHPWEHYKDFFVANKRTNGCRELFAIELPWIIDTFGDIETIDVLKNKTTKLELSYFDNYLILLKHKNGNMGTLNVDIVSRKAIRSFEMYNEDIHIFWDGTPNSLREYNSTNKEFDYIDTYKTIDKDSRYSENIIENAYLEELNAFIKYLEGDKSFVKYSFEKDLKILSIIDKIEGE